MTFRMARVVTHPLVFLVDMVVEPSADVGPICCSNSVGVRVPLCVGRMTRLAFSALPMSSLVFAAVSVAQ